MGPSATPPKDQGRLTRLSPAPYAGRRRGRQRDRRDDIGGGHSMDLKKWIARVSVVVLALVLVAPTALAQTSKEPIKIGVLNELTGPLAVNGSEVNEGIKLYWQDEMANQVAGRPVRLIVEDSEGKPDRSEERRVGKEGRAQSQEGSEEK